MSHHPFRTAALALLISALATGCGGADEPQPASEAPEERPTRPAEAPAPAGPAGGAQAALPAGVTAEMVQEGKQVFEGQGICFTCHASDGTGTTLAPDLTDDAWIWVDRQGGEMLTQIATIIRSGVSAPKEYPAPMPPMGGAQLSDAQVQAVAAYVYSMGGSS
jgi:mono/diheme cytochrome c family protein